MKHLVENKKTAAFLLVAIIVVGIAVYIILTANIRSTENAYINADVVDVAAQVPGRVIAVYVKDNQLVHKGDPLFDIDPEPYRIALARAQADLAQAMQTAREDDAEVAASRAQVEQTSVDLGNARANYTRAKELVARHFLSQQAADDAQTRVEALQAALDEAKAKLEKALSAPSDLDKRADVLKARADVDQAKLNLGYTHIVAEQDGEITNLSLTPGSLVAVGTPLFALIAKNSFHIDANFKETQLSGIHPGQPVDIDIDMYPDHRFHGTVESLSGGTGTAFSLLPPQNATGNWVKIAQRVPVRIKLDQLDPEYPLRIGATATVKVHIH
jgi:membrane fusion protein (multidrug efflux system)